MKAIEGKPLESHIDQILIPVQSQKSFEMKEIQQALDRAELYGLQIEVVYSALHYKEFHPESSISECMKQAVEEWIK